MLAVSPVTFLEIVIVNLAIVVEFVVVVPQIIVVGLKGLDVQGEDFMLPQVRFQIIAFVLARGGHFRGDGVRKVADVEIEVAAPQLLFALGRLPNPFRHGVTNMSEEDGRVRLARLFVATEIFRHKCLHNRHRPFVRTRHNHLDDALIGLDGAGLEPGTAHELSPLLEWEQCLQVHQNSDHQRSPHRKKLVPFSISRWILDVSVEPVVDESVEGISARVPFAQEQLPKLGVVIEQKDDTPLDVSDEPLDCCGMAHELSGRHLHRVLEEVRRRILRTFVDCRLDDDMNDQAGRV